MTNIVPHPSAAYKSCVYSGIVVHKRLRPKPHAMSYRVFALLLDVDEINRLDREVRGFSRNRRNWMSFYDRDHGGGGHAPIGEHIRKLLRDAGLGGGESVRLLCYPRMLGFVFNPLSVYFCADGSGQTRTIVYEVNNTFGERTSYVIPVDATEAAGVIGQTCAKAMAVSPFTQMTGSYGFRVRPPGDRVLVGVNFRDPDGPVLKTHFAGNREPLGRHAVAQLMLGYPLMTAKVIAGIHWEAGRIWAKGVPLVRRKPQSANTTAISRPLARETSHAE